jgi:hypothetical protein
MFNGVKRAYVLQILYIMKIIEQYGTDQAIDFLEQAAKRQGTIIAKELIRKLPKNMRKLDIGAEIYRIFMTDAGSEISEYKRDKNSVTFLVERCPFYEAFLEVGVDCGIFLNKLCKNLTLPTIQASIAYFDEKLKVEPIITRESSEDFCLEQVLLSKD